MRLLILGSGLMARSHVSNFTAIDGIEVAACADLDLDRAKAFAESHNIPQAYTSLSEAMAAESFDAVANATPDAAHFQTTMDALDAGLHVFCEKPLATNRPDADRMVEKAKTADRVNGVNLTYRNVSALQRAKTLIAEGAIGQIRHIEASYLQSWLTQPAWGDWRTEDAWLWRLSKAHGSMGVLGDVGVHILDFVSYATGLGFSQVSADLHTISKAPGDRIGEYQLDANDTVTMTCRLDGGVTGVVHATRLASGHLNDLSLRIFGDRGGLSVDNRGDLGRLSICDEANLQTATWTELPLEPVQTNYQRFANALLGRARMDPDFQTGATLQAVIDGAFESATKGQSWRLKNS